LGVAARSHASFEPAWAQARALDENPEVLPGSSARRDVSNLKMDREETGKCLRNALAIDLIDSVGSSSNACSIITSPDSAPGKE
jgi:hypothetical protein